jgi:hypothetical protein
MQPKNEFVQFLIKAKQNTYAAQSDEAGVPPLLTGSHQLEYGQGPWFYRDVYFGGNFFVGQETVYRNEEPVWSMGYAGGLLNGVVPAPEAEPVYAFLQEALRQVGEERPFRGPHTFQQGEYAFSDIGEGGVDAFWGVETITFRQKPVYRLRYHGGFIRD